MSYIFSQTICVFNQLRFDKQAACVIPLQFLRYIFQHSLSFLALPVPSYLLPGSDRWARDQFAFACLYNATSYGAVLRNLWCSGHIHRNLSDHGTFRRSVSERELTLICSLCSFSICFILSTPWRTATLWALVGFVLYIAVTALLFRDWSNTKDRNYWHPNMHRLDLVMASASISLVTALIYLLDVLLTIRFGVHGELEWQDRGLFRNL